MEPQLLHSGPIAPFCLQPCAPNSQELPPGPVDQDHLPQGALPDLRLSWNHPISCLPFLLALSSTRLQSSGLLVSFWSLPLEHRPLEGRDFALLNPRVLNSRKHRKRTLNMLKGREQVCHAH